MELKFYKCKHCGQIIAIVKRTGVPVVCCGEKMEELIPGTVEASHEKHIPVYRVENNKVYVEVGSVEHPMIPEHFIEWVAVETNKGFKVAHLTDEDNPEAKFAILEDEMIESVYAYCNLHGLWKA